jgi:hypothetical protein
MKKLILSITLICFIGTVKIYAQTSDAKATKPATAATATEHSTSTATTVSGGQSVQTPATVKTTAKGENKKACCSHSSKSCCMSKDGSMKMEGNTKESEKSDTKSNK